MRYLIDDILAFDQIDHIKCVCEFHKYGKSSSPALISVYNDIFNKHVV